MASFNSYPSSSSSVPTRKYTYHVFLSFRGEDTRYNFVDHLHTALLQRGIRVFKDDKTPQRGKHISSELLTAIEESRFAVVVFSENYGNSSWCLEEVAKIMECHALIGLKVLPVFYHVDPSDVRGQKRDFATAFEQHESRFSGEIDKVNKWRKALSAAAHLSGWHILKTGNGGESAFIDKIVQVILGGIRPRGDQNNIIGIDSHINVLNSLLATEATKEVLMIGICGMGGIGKTTISQALFSRISYKFEGCSFIKHVRESKRDLCSLQEKILRDILLTRQGFMIEDPDHGAEILRERLCNKKVLLVLDDVDSVKQLELLAARHDWFGSGSRIIITTRDEHLLSKANAKYKPDLLHMDQALELFSMHAFHKNSPPHGYEDLSNRAVCYTGRLPLALKVLGSFFHGRQLGVWESALNRLAKTPDREIYETLKISFDGLVESEKKILLDIACFFKGEEVEHVTRILDSFDFDPTIGISVLIEKSLITISNKRIDIHDLIQEMSWQIVRQSYPNSRLWKAKDISDFITRNKKLKAIEAIMVPNGQYDEIQGLSAIVFERMDNLRLLHIGRQFTSSEPTFFPDKLRWFYWERYPFLSLPVANLSKLVGLEISIGNIEQLWKGCKIMPHLKLISLEALGRLTKFPDVSGTPNIERLVLTKCPNLVEVHESLGSHRRLVYLEMSCCEKLKCFSSKIEMESLETLNLSNCHSLERFPEVAPCMIKLTYINLAFCCRIKELPSSIRYLSSLSFLNLTDCTSLHHIPNSICELQHLKSLDLMNCSKLQTLPEEVGRIKNLQMLRLGFVDEIEVLEMLHEFPIFPTLTSFFSLKKLDLSWRQIKDDKFPQDLHAFSSLEELYLSGNLKLIRLPASISHLSRLKHLELNGCRQLQYLSRLPSEIQVLKASNCSSLEKIEDLSQEYEWLHKIWLFGCDKLREDQDNQTYLDKMLHQSFLKKCASVDHRLSIAISGSKIPSWFEEQHGEDITLKLPPKFHTIIMGFAVCGLFPMMWHIEYTFPKISITITDDEKLILESKFDCINASATANGDIVWLSYIPFSFFQRVNGDWNRDWSHIIEGNIVVNLTFVVGGPAVRCGATVVYKKDVEQFQPFKTPVSDDYWTRECVSHKGNSFVYEEKVWKT